MVQRYRKREMVGLKIDNVTTKVAIYGYMCGGDASVTTDRITFATSVTAANTVSNISLGRRQTGALSDKSTYGYISGGYSTANTSVTDMITFSTGATAARTAANLSALKGFGPCGVSDGATYGYMCGGQSNNAVTAHTDRITFSTQATAANTVSNLSTVRQTAGRLSDGETYGYMCGGYSNNYSAVSDRLTFSTGATAARTAVNLSLARAYTSGLMDATYGYVSGGVIIGAATASAITDKVTFSTSTSFANTTSNLVTTRYGQSSNNDGVIYGYTSGGETGSSVKTSNTERFTYSTATFASNTVSNLSSARLGVSGLSDFAV